MNERKKHTDRIWRAGLLFALLLLLCGCTKKEDILLLSEETEEAAEGAAAFPQDAGGQPSVAGGDQSGSYSGSREFETPSTPLPVREDDAVTQSGVIYVHVCGAVAQPGVYELETGSRVYEAVEQAGGFAENAEQNYVNQAQALEDGVKLVIPTREEAAAAGEQGAVLAAGTAQDDVGKEIGIVAGRNPDAQGGDGDSASDGRININTASETQLCEIPGVGATRAAAIAAYRESHGAFEKPEDIMKVNGIKEGMYEKIKDSISVK